MLPAIGKYIFWSLARGQMPGMLYFSGKSVRTGKVDAAPCAALIAFKSK
jgi:hypothetical protein